MAEMMRSPIGRAEFQRLPRFLDLLLPSSDGIVGSTVEDLGASVSSICSKLFSAHIGAI